MAELIKNDTTERDWRTDRLTELRRRVAAKYEALTDAAEEDPERLRDTFRLEDWHGSFEEYVADTTARLRASAANARRRAKGGDE